MRSTVLTVCALLVSGAAVAQGPTPGPASRAGGAIDRAWGTVRGEVGEALLSARVRVALLEHLKRDGLRVHIETIGDRVALSGEVERRASQELAEQVAQSVSGVREVENRLTVVRSPKDTTPVAGVVDKAEREVSDALLETKVKARVIEELGRPGFGVEVEATDGVVSLSGTVPDSARRELAEKAARSPSGVRELHNLLRIGAEKQ